MRIDEISKEIENRMDRKDLIMVTSPIPELSDYEWQIISFARNRDIDKLVEKILGPIPKEPRRSHVAFGHDGEARAAFGDRAYEKYQSDPEIARIETREPTKSQIGKWNAWHRRAEEIKQLINDNSDYLFYRHVNELGSAQGTCGKYGDLLKRLADILGATKFKVSTSNNPIEPWFAKGFGGRGILFLDGHAGASYFDMGIDGRTILIPQIAFEKKGTGIGKMVMEEIKNFADEHRLKIAVYKVTNKEFFRKFPWLEETEYHDFVYDPMKER